jgi:2-polyprenyl-6-methoxyphenol hydroxylase-like FAD-dependent oxidoreductase
MFPVRSSGMQRLIGLVPPELSHRENLAFEDIRAQVEPLLDVKVTEVNWFSTYRVHHRVAEKFRVGRAFLVGDAAHIHSPAGGQGMNTEIGDAINLGWKIAHVLQNRADTSLLDTYEPERIRFARSLVSTTDHAFTGLVAEGVAGEFTRKIVSRRTSDLMSAYPGASAMTAAIILRRTSSRAFSLLRPYNGPSGSWGRASESG